MGLLGNILGNGLNNIAKGVTKGVGDGIGKGLADAVGKAVNDVMAPTAEKLAGQAAEAVTSTFADVKKANEELQDSLRDADAELQQATGTTSAADGFARLGEIFSGMTAAAENYATTMSSQLKECPACGEAAPANHTFCPSCGAKLPDETIGQLYTCSACGRQNTPGTTFCAGCGAKLPAAVKAEQNFVAKWAELLPQFPAWTLGGKGFDLYTDDEHMGYPIVRATIKGAGEAALNQYVATLKTAGFTEDTEQRCCYKMINGVCWVADMYEAFYDDGNLNLNFCAEDPKRFAKPQAQPAAASNPLDDLGDALKDAGSAFGKLFGGFGR